MRLGILLLSVQFSWLSIYCIRMCNNIELNYDKLNEMETIAECKRANKDLNPIEMTVVPGVPKLMAREEENQRLNQAVKS